MKPLPHDCLGDECNYCQRLIDQMESDRDYPPPFIAWWEP